MTPVIRPASSTQRAFWLIQDRDPDSPAYLLLQAFELHGPLDTSALARSIDLLAARHEVLRTGFTVRDDEVVQVIHPHATPRLSIADLSGHPDRQAVVTSTLEREAALPFDLAVPPLIRARLLRTGPDEHILVFSLHHIVTDETSLHLLWQELSDTYATLTRGDTPPRGLPDVAQFSGYAAWERGWLHSAAYRDQLDYWQRELAGATPLDLPWPARPRGPSWQGGSHRAWLPAEDTEAVRQFSARHQASSFMTLLAVFAGVLHRWTAQPDIVVGTPVSLRDRPGSERIVGLLLNSVALRTRWAEDPSLVEAVTQVRQTTLEALSRLHVPFDHVVARAPHLRVPGENPVFQVAFSYVAGRGGRRPALELPGLRACSLWLRPRVSKFLLSVDCVADGDRLLCVVEWSDRWFDEELGRLFADHFTRAVRFAVRHPQARVGQWPLDDEQGDTDPAAGLDPEWMNFDNVWR